MDFPDVSSVTTSEISPGTTHLTCLFYGFGETDFSKLNNIYCLWSKYPISVRNLAYFQTCMLPSVSYFKYKCLMTMKQTWYLQVFNDHCNKTFCSGFLLFSIFQMTFHGGLFQGIFLYVFHSLVYFKLTTLKNDGVNQAKQVLLFLFYLEMRFPFSLFPLSFFISIVFFPISTSPSLVCKCLLWIYKYL